MALKPLFGIFFFSFKILTLFYLDRVERIKGHHAFCLFLGKCVHAIFDLNDHF